ncbi:DUF1365 domain-containing protein [Streptomyces sp. Y1]|uniref:DUF1365 domain-containing protein n=1 Tax=Streptomyces sp. Y1 TaxID=3238634 RepID=A0AB39TWJ0_9ACTN
MAADTRQPTAGSAVGADTLAPAPPTAPALPGPWGAALYECRISHARTAPVHHAFRHHTYLWLTDLDRPPLLPWPLRLLASFPAGGRTAGSGRSPREDLDRYLDSAGVDLAGGRVLMLAHARSLGYVFNPLTVYWCYDRRGRAVCTVAEVHNTYGQRHRYLLHPDERGRARAAKEFYVSPFFPVDGHYRMFLPVPGERLTLAVQLEREGGRPFTATVRGTRRPARGTTLLRAAATHPLSTLAVSAHIRYQGVRLWLRGLPVHLRPDRAPSNRTCRHDHAR